MSYLRSASSSGRVAVTLALALLIPSVHADNKSQTEFRAPFAWGVLSAAKGCVIFREYTKSKKNVLGYKDEKPQSELEVVETDGYVLEPKEWEESDASLHELQIRALANGVRYVKVQDKYTPEELQAARALCQKESLIEE